MLEAERSGRWQDGVGLVIIVLIPKGDGTYRPIGLMPWLPRLWMRARRINATTWERVNDRSWIYAGTGKGADIAAWNQSARAEMAAIGRWKTGYAQALLDLVKAFERVPYWLLVREAVELGYPMWMLRLSIATYKLPRTLRVGAVYSKMIVAIRGITAGSGLATTEMRLCMLRIVEKALKLHRTVVPTLFVDDLSAECTGPDHVILEELVPFINGVAADIEGVGMELSRKKSICTANSDTLGKQLEECWTEIGVTYQRYAKSLGVGMGAGIRRNAKVARARLHNFKKRIPLFRRLKNLRIDPAKIVRTGGKAAITYGQGVLGVSNAMLRLQRRAVAKAAAIGYGTGGQQLDLGLMIADGGTKGGADPAFDAHVMPITEWAKAVWEVRLPRKSLQALAANAQRKLARARNVWAAVNGPGTAFVATCARLNWTIIDGMTLRTDNGLDLDLRVDPPAAVQKQVVMSVERWRWRNVEWTCPELAANGAGRGAMMNPIRTLLKSKANSAEWNPTLRGGLKSVTAGRQWTQTRVRAAGWSTHNRCLACLQTIVEDEETSWQREARIELLRDSSKSGRVEVQANQGQIDRAPIGDPFHRCWKCPHLQPSRLKHASSEDLARTMHGWGSGKVAFERALVPLPPPPERPPAAEATFHWHVKPGDAFVAGRFYTDGSALDGPNYELMRCGWSFVALDDTDAIVAAAYGVTPPWIRDIGGAEGWALLQAAQVAFPGACTFTSDCKVIVDSLQLGRAKAVGAGSAHARIYALLFTAFDDTPLEAIVWMPAHQIKGAADTRVKSNGAPLTRIDIEANGEADKLAKRAVEEHRVPFRLRDEWRRCHETTKQRAMWIARATVEANNLPNYPFSDSASSRPAAEEAKKLRLRVRAMKGPIETKMFAVARPPTLGGHLIVSRLCGKKLGWS